MVELDETWTGDKSEDTDRSFHVTRRGFIAGSAASALVAGGALGAEKPKDANTWLYSRFDDGPDRYIHKLSYVRADGISSSALYFRERAFGLLARIGVGPILRRDLKGADKGIDEETGRVDLRLSVVGATLLPEGLADLAARKDRFFGLNFSFYHNHIGQTANFDPSIDVHAEGWVFGKRSLLASVKLDDWMAAKQQPIRAGAQNNGLPERLRRAIFADLIGAPGTELYLMPQLQSEDDFVWRISTIGAAESDPRTSLCVSTRAGVSPSTPLSEFQPTAAACASILDIWRETPPPLSTEVTKSASAKEGIGQVEDSVGDAKPVGSIIRGALRDARAIGPQLVLAEQNFAQDTMAGVGFAVLEQPHLADPSKLGAQHEPVEFARWATVDEQSEKSFEVIAARAIISGDLNVLTAPQANGSGPRFTEGPLPVEKGQLCLSQTFEIQPGGSKRAQKAEEVALNLDCRFPIAEGSFTLATSLGVFSAEKPEEKMPEPGLKRGEAPIAIRAKDFGVTHFAATVRITDASVALLDRGDSNPEIGAPRGHFSRLDFLGGSEIALRLHGLTEPEVLHSGRIVLGTTNGLPLPASPDAPACSLPMEGAQLRVLRYGDLADLRLRFAGFDLVNDGTRTTLRPRGLAVVARIGDPQPAKPPQRGATGDGKQQVAAEIDKIASKDATTKKTDTLAEPLTGPVHDPRPMIVVELPPQHRGEQAFFQLRQARPTPPKLPAKARQTNQFVVALQDLYRSYTTDSLSIRVKRRADILRWLMAALRGKDDNDDDWWTKKWPKLGVLLNGLPAPEGSLAIADDSSTQVEICKFVDFAEAFAAFFETTADDKAGSPNRPPRNFPGEQKLYAGPEFLDPDTQRYAELVQRSLEAASFDDGGNPVLDQVPVDPVSREELDALKANLQGKSGGDKEALNEADALRDQRNPYYRDFVKAYGDSVPGVGYPRGYTPTQGNPLTEFSGGDNFRQLVIDIYRKFSAEEDDKKRDDNKKIFDEWWARLVKALQIAMKVIPQPETGAENPSRPVDSRLSGTTRLAFRVNTDDYEPGFAGGELPFTVDALTDFSRFELSVVRRAQKLLLSHQDGTRRPAWDSETDQDFSHMLVHQGFSRGGAELERPDLRRQDNDEPGLVEPPEGRQWSEARVTVDQRLAEVAKLSSEPPSLLETAIEMPFRLMLSPSQDALFRTPRGVPQSLYRQSVSDADADQSASTQVLWTAELDPEAGAETRAIWSPDFRPEAFLPQEPRRASRWQDILDQARDSSALPKFISRYFPRKRSRVNHAPLRGPYAPWAMGRHVSSLNLEDAKQELGDHRFRTSLDAFDRHELVALTSVHGLPVLGRVSLSGARLGKDQREPPPGFQVSLMGVPTNKTDPYDLNDIYVPRPLDPQGFELALSSLGGFLAVNASFEPPAAIVDYERGALFDALSIERWRHRIVLGRDISAEVVYKGYLMPFGIRASLIKSTERRFERIGGRGGPVAVLRQRMFIRIAKPEKEFGAFRQPDDGRRVPFRKVRILTVQTPDIVDPFDLAGTRDQTGVWPGGLIDVVKRTPAPIGDAAPGTPFWPRTARRAGAEVIFEVLLDDKVRLRMPMVFVDNVTVNNEDSLRRLAYYYNLQGTPPAGQDKGLAPYVARASLVQRPLFNQKLVFAPPENEGDTEFETETITFAVEGGRDENYNSSENPDPKQPDEEAARYSPIYVNRNYANDPFLNGADQPPFYPAMRRASVHVKQIERLTGQTNDPVTVGYDSVYALRGFDPPEGSSQNPPDENPPKKTPKKNPRDIFLALIANLPMQFADEGQRGGAVARPQIGVVALSRSRGPIGSKDGSIQNGKKPGELPSSPDGVEKPDPPEIPPASYNVHSNSLADFFGDSAKLLGIVKISDLLKLLTDSTDLEPKLREIKEFGGGLVDDADVFIRENVLIPVRNALGVFDEKLRQLRYNGVDGASALQRIYPEVSQTKAEFVGQLDRAISAMPPSEDTDATIEIYSSVYATGRRFAQAVERVTRDPLTPLREAVRNSVEEFVDNVTKQVMEAASELRERFKPDLIRAGVIKLLQEQLLTTGSPVAATALAKAIFRLPIPVSPPLADTALQILDESYVETILMEPGTDNGQKQKSPWSTEPDKPIFDLKTFAATFFDKVAEKGANDPVLKDWADKQAARVQSSLDQFEGTLWLRFEEIVVTNLTLATATLANLATPPLDQLVAALENVGAPLAQGFKDLKQLAEIADKWQAECANLISATDDFVRVIFPRSVNDPKVCIGTKDERDWVKCNDRASFPPFYRLIGGIVRLADVLEALGGNNGGKLDALIRAVWNYGADGTVSAALFPLIQLRATLTPTPGPDKGLREHIIDAREKLLAIGREFDALKMRYDAAYQKASSFCDKPARLVQDLFDVLADLERKRNDALQELAAVSGALGDLLSQVLPEAGGQQLLTKPGSTSVKPALDADPKDWAWGNITASDVASASDAIYFIETAKKDILAALLRPVSLSASFVADATAIAALISEPSQKGLDKDRDAARLTLLKDIAKLQLPQAANSFFQSLVKALSKDDQSPFGKSLAALIKRIEDEIGKLLAVELAVAEFAAETAGTGAIDADKLADLKAYLAARLGQLKKDAVQLLIDTANDQIDQVAEGLESQVLRILPRIVSGAGIAFDKLLGEMKAPLAALVRTAADAFKSVQKARDELVASLPAGSGGAASLNASLTKLLVACPADLSNSTNDRLAIQASELQTWAGVVESKPAASEDFKNAVDGFLGRLLDWTTPDNLNANSCKADAGDGPNAVVVIFRQVKNAIDTLVRGEFARLIDIGAVRREVEARLRDLIPTRITLAYDLNVDLKHQALGIFIPNYPATDDPTVADNYDSSFAPCSLTLKARTYIDLLKPSPPKVDVSGSLGAFKVKLVGDDFDVLTLQFDGARYGSDTGGKLKTNVTDFKLGKMVEFLDSISQWVSFGDSGFFLALRYDLPGIEAGYRMPPIYLTLGALNISNVSLNASCVLPFSDGSALFKVGVSRPEAPFSITATVYGGCGHLALYANPSGIIGFSASLEFGAILDFRLGPVTGSGRISAGVYIRSIDMGDRRVATIEGIFTATGSAKIAMFSIMAMLQVRVGQQASGGVAGHAIFVFSFSLGIKNIEFRFVIFKQEQKGFSGGGMSGPQSSLESPTRFAAAGTDPVMTSTVGDWQMWASGESKDGPTLSSITTCKSENFAGYMNYFSEASPWIPS